MTTHRCPWADTHPLNAAYHDSEWGVPLYDDQRLFEFLILEGMQAGLSWLTILKKREHYRKGFHNFDAVSIARFTEKKQLALLQDPGIIRNRLKVASIVNNAKIYLDVIEEYGNFSDYIWQFTDNKTLVGNWQSKDEVPASTELSTLISKELKKKGFKFLGPTTVYAFMQSVGLLNDHTTDCFRFNA